MNKEFHYNNLLKYDKKKHTNFFCIFKNELKGSYMMIKQRTTTKSYSKV